MIKKFLALTVLSFMFFWSASSALAQNTNALMHKAVKLSLQQKFPEALEILEGIIKREPGNLFAYNNIGQVYLMKNDLDNAEKSYKKALEIKPTFPMSLNNLGQVYKLRGDFDKAETMYKKAVQEFPALGIAHGGLGELYLLQKRTDEAIVSLSLAIKHNPSNPQYHLMLSQAYEAKGLHEEAKTHKGHYLKNPGPPAIPK